MGSGGPLYAEDNGTMAQEDLFEPAAARSLLGQLLDDSRLYNSSKDYLELLRFVARLRTFAPFNAMLLHLQKPGLGYAATKRDWRERFGRETKNNARPLLVLMPFGPVALVYDVIDTEGRPLPRDAFSFTASGPVGDEEVRRAISSLAKWGITCVPVDLGDRHAGSIQVTRRGTEEHPTTAYRIDLNANHGAVVRFATLAHELGHLYMGHLGADKTLLVPDRRQAQLARQELEAESVAYLVCARNGVASRSENYLAAYVDENTTVDAIDIYQVMRAAGQIESALGLAAHERGRAKKTKRKSGWPIFVLHGTTSELTPSESRRE